ncbi:kinase-like domain-containing protein [Pisolithus albus]|nr:kinase-like domain-containing protein [Pisolithus albus]
MSNDYARQPRQDHGDGDPKMIGLWKIGRTIGKGSSGRVRIARHVKTHQLAAVKIVPKSTILNPVNKPARHTFLSIEREIVIMKLIDHPNILRLYDVWETHSDLYLILEYVEGGELFDYLCNKGPLSTAEALVYFQQIIFAVDYCHRFNIAHRDLKPENLLMDRDKNIKIADFGMAAWQASSNNGLLRTSCGSPHYAAPEVIMGKEYDGRASDIWSCGVILFALLTGHLPFDDEDLTALLEKVKSGKYDMPLGIDTMAKDLISKMLLKDPEKRISMAEILQHPFFLSQEPKVCNKRIPDLILMTRPIPMEVDIDQNILRNLRTLWHGTPDKDIIESLRNDEPNWQKGVYHLLAENRRRRLENYDAEEEEFFAQEREKRRERRRSEGIARCTKCTSHTRDGDYSPSVLAPRAEHPKPSRARCLLCNKDQPFSPRLFHSTHTSRRTQTPRSDDAMHDFFHQLVERLNTMAIRTGMRAPPLQDSGTISGRSPVCQTSRWPYNPRAVLDEDVHQGMKTYRTSLPKSDKSKFPRIFRKSCTSDDTVSRQSSLRVKIIEPSPKMMSRRKSLRASFFSSVSSDSSSTLASTRRRSWLGNAFKSKPASYELLSVQNTFTTREECHKLLVGLGVRITLTHTKEAGVLKCKFDGVEDPRGTLPVIKFVAFRVEVHQPTTPQALAGYQVVLRFIHEKGDPSSFQTIYHKLRRVWELNVLRIQEVHEQCPTALTEAGKPTMV